MKIYDADEVAKHNTAECCWVILYGDVYDVTSFLPEHPGGAKIILQLAGKDATESFDPIHPSGTLEENLSPEAKIGKVDKDTTATGKETASNGSNSRLDQAIDLQSLLNIDEIEAAGTKNMSKQGWAYYYSAADDLVTKHQNTLAYRSILLRPRVFVDCSTCSTQTSFLGFEVKTPIYVASAALARLAHPSGEIGLAKACQTFGACQVIAQNASMRPEEIVANAPSWQVFGWQIYVQTDLRKSETMLARINALKPKIKFLVLTLDAPVPGKREDDIRAKESFDDIPQAAVHEEGQSPAGASDSGGIGARLFQGTNPSLTWNITLPWLVKHTNLPLILKGVQTHEDAALALQYPQIKGIVLSNHGGRALDTAPPAVHTLLEIHKYCPAVLSKLEVYVDGGIKRGTDIVKALCLGARGVGLGRAALWGLAAGGQAGVERTMQILQDELVTAMKLLGAENIGQLGPWHVNTRVLERDIYDRPALSHIARTQLHSKL